MEPIIYSSLSLIRLRTEEKDIYGRRSYTEGRIGADGKENRHKREGKETSRREKWPIGSLTHSPNTINSRIIISRRFLVKPVIPVEPALTGQNHDALLY